MSRRQRPRLRSALRAGSLLDTLLAGWGIDGRVQQYRAVVLWDDTVGAGIAAHTRPEKIRDGVLEVCVDQAAWMQQLHLLKPQILTKLNAQLGDQPLRDLFLKRGRVARCAPPAPAAGPRWRETPLADGEAAQIRALLDGVADDGLRHDLERLLVKQARLTKARETHRS